MPYVRDGATKVSDHWVRSPLLNIDRACQTCHKLPEDEIEARVDGIQERNHRLLQHAGQAVVDLIDAVLAARAAGAGEEQLASALELQRQSQWRLDFVAAENSMGFHAPQEAARILGEAADLARQGQIAALTWRNPGAPVPAAAMGEGSDAGAAPAETAAPSDAGPTD
jgi:nitrite reductase (cytochrome c-552)